MAKNARKRKNPVDRKPVFLLVRVVKINIYKELSRFNFKKSTKDCRTLCKPRISRQVFLSCHGKKIEQNDSLPMTFNVV